MGLAIGKSLVYGARVKQARLPQRRSGPFHATTTVSFAADQGRK